MMETIVGGVIGIFGAALIGLAAWFYKLGNRVSVLEANETGLNRLIDAKLTDISRRLSDIELVLRRTIHIGE